MPEDKKIDLTGVDNIPSKSTKIDLTGIEDVPLKKKVSTEPLLPQSPLIQNQNIPSTSGGFMSGLENGKLEPTGIDYLTGTPLKSESLTSEPLYDDFGVKTLIQPPSQKSLGSEMLGRIASGSSKLGFMMAKTPAFLYDVAAMITNPIVRQFGGEEASSEKFAETFNLPDNKVASYYKKQYEILDKDFNEKYDKSVSEYFDNNEYGKGFSLLANSVAESIPVTLSLAMGNAAGISTAGSIVGGGAVFGAGKMDELDASNPEMDKGTKVAVAAANGLIEGTFESMFGLTKLGSLTKKILQNEGKEQAVKVAKEGFMKVYGKPLSKYLGVSAEEGVSEAATQFAQNAVDKYSGVNPDLDLRSGVKDAFYIGLASGASLSSPTAILDVVKTRSNLKKAQEISSKKQALENDLNNDAIPDDIKATLSDKVKELNEQEFDIVSNEKESFNNLDEESKAIVNDNLNKINELTNALSSEGLSEETVSLINKDLELKENEIEQLINPEVNAEDKTEQSVQDEKAYELDSSEKAVPVELSVAPESSKEDVVSDIKPTPEVVSEKKSENADIGNVSSSAVPSDVTPNEGAITSEPIVEPVLNKEGESSVTPSGIVAENVTHSIPPVETPVNEVSVSTEEKPKRTSVKSLSKNLYDSKSVYQKVKDVILEKGFNRTVVTHEEASKNAREIINELGHVDALNVAKDRNSDIPANTRALIYGNVLSDYSQLENEANTEEDKIAFADMQAEIQLDAEDFMENFEKESTEAGRFISAIDQIYNMSALGISRKLNKQVERSNKKKKRTLVRTNEEFKNVVDELNAIDEKYSAGEVKPDKDKVKEIRDKRKSLISKLKDSFNTPLGFASTPENIYKRQREQNDLMVEIVKTYIEEGVVRAKNIYTKLKKDLKSIGIEVSDEDIDYINKQKIGDETIGDLVQKDSSIKSREEKIKVLEKALKKKTKLRSSSKNKKDYERMIDLWDNGVSGSEFESAFYEKFGLVDQNAEEVKAKMDEFSKKIFNAEGVLKNREYQNMLNWLADYKRNKYVEFGMSYWYANILSSYETHGRNLKFNIITALLAQPLLLTQKHTAKLIKAVTNKDSEAAGKALSDIYKTWGTLFSSFKEGGTDAWSILKSGEVSRFEEVAQSNALERVKPNNKLLKALLAIERFSGRGLRASDVVFTTPLYNVALRDIMSAQVDAQALKDGRSLTKEQRDKAINDLMGNSKDNVANANEKSAKEIEKIYGENWKDNKEAVLYQKIRRNEIIDTSRPLEVRQEARQWARKATLMNKPEGVFGVLSDVLNALTEGIPALKILVPFTNVPLNIVDKAIQRGPLGFIAVARKKQGLGQGKHARQLTEKEISEYRKVAINYSIAMASVAIAAYALGGLGDDDENAELIVTGKEGDYFENEANQRGGGFKPYHVYKKVNGEWVSFDYQNSPFATVFSLAGIVRDLKKRNKEKELKGEDKAGVADELALGTLYYLKNTLALPSVKGLDQAARFFGEDNNSSIMKGVAKTLQSLHPVSGLVKSATQDIRGLMEMNKKEAASDLDYLLKGLPYDYYMNDKIDVLGRPIKEKAEMSLIPVAEKDNFPVEEDGSLDKYNKMFYDKGYDVSSKFVKNTNAYTDEKGDFNMDKKELYELNKLKGDITKEILDKPGVMDKLSTMSNDGFKTEMDKIIRKSTEMAKIQKFVLEDKLPKGKSILKFYQEYKNKIKKDKKKNDDVSINIFE